MSNPGFFKATTLVIICHSSSRRLQQTFILGVGCCYSKCGRAFGTVLGQRLEEVEKHDKKSIDCHEQAVGRNTDVKNSAGEGSIGNMEEKSGIVLENPSVGMSTLQAEIWMRRALPVRRAQTE